MKKKNIRPHGSIDFDSKYDNCSSENLSDHHNINKRKAHSAYFDKFAQWIFCSERLTSLFGFASLAGTGQCNSFGSTHNMTRHVKGNTTPN